MIVVPSHVVKKSWYIISIEKDRRPCEARRPLTRVAHNQLSQNWKKIFITLPDGKKHFGAKKDWTKKDFPGKNKKVQRC